MKSTRPVILNDEIYDLPLHANAALAARAIARVLDILPHTNSKPWPDEAVKLAIQIKERLEEIASTTQLNSEKLAFGHPGYEESRKIKKTLELEPDSYAPTAWLCVCDALNRHGVNAQSALSWCANLTWDIAPRSESKKAERIVKNANWDDFAKLRLAYESGELTKDTPIPIEFLGTLWSKGPHDWSQYTWRDLEAEKAELERQVKQQEEERDQILKQLVHRDDTLHSKIREALDETAKTRGDDWRHAFVPEGARSSKKWPAALRNSKLSFVEELRDFYAVHAWGALYIPPGELGGSLWIFPPEEMLNQRREMLEWDSALDCFDSEAVDEANRISVANGWEPDAKLAPCSKRDLLLFAKVDMSPDAFFIVTKGPVAGKVFYFDHETGIDFDQPIADSLVGWINAISDRSNEWQWLEDQD